MDLMRAAGLDPRIDTAGNILATRDVSDRSLKPILFGSHIDSVPAGGNFDGDLGSMSAIEVMRTLKNHNVTTRHPLKAAIWQNEEGGLVGSRAALGDALDMEGIVSIDEYDVEIRGFANHAGTTPMQERRDALLAAIKLIQTVQDVVRAEPGRQIGTVGRLTVFPMHRTWYRDW